MDKDKKPVKRKSNGKNSPVIGMNGYDLKPGDNTKFMLVNIALFNMERIDLHDVNAVIERLNEYFKLYAENDMKPTVAGMAMALGMNRHTLWAITHDKPTGGDGYYSTLPKDVALIIKNAYEMLENLWESYMNSGKINPVAGIFLAKNNYGYQDKTETVLTPNVKTENDYSVEEIKQRYLTDKSDS